MLFSLNYYINITKKEIEVKRGKYQILDKHNYTTQDNAS